MGILFTTQIRTYTVFLGQPMCSHRLHCHLLGSWNLHCSLPKRGRLNWWKNKDYHCFKQREKGRGISGSKPFWIVLHWNQNQHLSHLCSFQNPLLCKGSSFPRKSFPVDEVLPFSPLLSTMWKKSGFVSRRRFSIFFDSFFSFFFSLFCLIFSRCKKFFRTFQSFFLSFFFIDFSRFDFFPFDLFLLKSFGDEHLFNTLHLYSFKWKLI